MFDAAALGWPFRIMKVLLALLAALFLAAPLMAEDKPLTVAVDIGHYKKRPGSVSARGIPELEFNMNMGKQIAAGWTVRRSENVDNSILFVFLH